jgi:hypothetical protein
MFMDGIDPCCNTDMAELHTDFSICFKMRDRLLLLSIYNGVVVFDFVGNEYLLS